jgi:hypothetical protein
MSWRILVSFGVIFEDYVFAWWRILSFHNPSFAQIAKDLMPSTMGWSCWRPNRGLEEGMEWPPWNANTIICSFEDVTDMLKPSLY